MDERKVIHRAMAAYVTYGAAGMTLPVWEKSTVERIRNPRHGLLEYAVLRNDTKTLAVFRIGNTGYLRLLHRWPKELKGGK